MNTKVRDVTCVTIVFTFIASFLVAALVGAGFVLIHGPEKVPIAIGGFFIFFLLCLLWYTAWHELDKDMGK
jgi:hypothetical protein